MSSRCYHYKHFKSLLTVERYLVLDIPLTHKRSLSKFRCASHRLRIEVGRHLNIPREERICTHCLTSRNVLYIDCEFHAFFYCCKYMYNDIRAQYLLNWYDRGMEIDDFYILMNSDCERTIRNVCNYVHHIMCKAIAD